MTRRRTLVATVLALLTVGGVAPALAAPASVGTDRACVFIGSDPHDRQSVCVWFPWPGSEQGR